MSLHARITLPCDFYCLHTRPAMWIDFHLRGIDASLRFIQGDASVEIRPEVAVVDIMQAATELQLDAGTTFEIVCEGMQARETLDALRTAFTTNYFEGSDFVEVLEEEDKDD